MAFEFSPKRVVNPPVQVPQYLNDSDSRFADNRLRSLTLLERINQTSGETTSVDDRNVAYDQWSDFLEGDPTNPHADVIPDAIQAVKFFRATENVTDFSGIGAAVDGVPFGTASPNGVTGAMAHPSPLSDPSRQLLSDINGALFTKNHQAFSKLVSDGQLFSPTGGKTPLTGLEFDLQMVEFEQGTVQNLLDDAASRDSLGTKNCIQEIDDRTHSAAADLVRKVASNPLDEAMLWASGLLGVEPTKLSFGNKDHRVAIGRAMVLLQHHKSQADYKAMFGGPQ